MNRFLNLAGVVSGLVGGAMFLVFFLAVQFALSVSLLLGAVGFVGAYILIYAFKPKNSIEFSYGDGITPELIASTQKEGDEKIRILQDYAKRIKDPKISDKINRIVAVIQRIFENFKKDPKEIRSANQFLSYYLDTAIKIVRKYNDLSAQNLKTPEITRTLLKAENMLDSIEKAFEIQQTRLLRDDVMDLDVEIETLEKTFNAEDLK